MPNNVYLNVDGNWTNTANWSLGAAPVTGDSVYIESGDKNITSNLDQNAVELASLNIAANFTGTIGVYTASTNTPLKIGASVVNVGYVKGLSNPQGSQLLNLNFHTFATVARVFSSASSASNSATLPVRIIANNSSSNLHITGGFVEIAGRAGETATLGIINVSQATAAANVTIGQIAADAVTATTVNISDGTVTIYSAPTTLNADGGNVTTAGTDGSWAIATRGGRLTHSASGSTTSLTAYSGSNVDMSKCDVARTVTTLTQHKGATFKRDKDIVTVTNWVLGDNGPVTASLN